MNDRRGNQDKPSFVFKTSEEKMNLAVAMNCAREGFLSEKYCYFDGKHKRCRGYITLTASVYHPLLRKQIPLAIMEAEQENTENVELFWGLFNEAIARSSNDHAERFNPVGWSTDMAGSNLAGICKVFGEQVRTRIRLVNFISRIVGIKRHRN